MSMQYSVTIEEKSNPDDEKFILDGLIEFNRQVAGEDHYRRFSIVARNEQNEPIGGLLGTTYYDWLGVDILWLTESVRGQGIGSAVLAAAEDEARKRGCRHVHLDTLEFQARGFYEKHGYTVFGELPDCPPGYMRYYMKKDL
jgi:GNAT superfamily N-acetyltransferase